MTYLELFRGEPPRVRTTGKGRPIDSERKRRVQTGLLTRQALVPVRLSEVEGRLEELLKTLQTARQTGTSVPGLEVDTPS